MREIGCIVSFGDHAPDAVAQMAAAGFTLCQIKCRMSRDYQDAEIDALAAALKTHGMRAVSLLCAHSGPAVWDLVEGPETLGIVPPAYRAQRVKELERASDIAARLGISRVITHVGFLPDDARDPRYRDTVDVLRELCASFAKRGQRLLMETGQETPDVLLRALRDVGAENLGVNFDCANLVMYGKADPVDALRILGAYVKGVHAKDGVYPTDAVSLGQEMPLGEGRVDFDALLALLDEIGYRGELIIERETAPEQRFADVLKARAFLLARIKP